MEGFFFKSCSVSEVVEEMLLRRYSNIDYIFAKDFEDGFSLIEVALDKEIEEKLWQQWLCIYPNMSEDNFISFNDFLRESKKPKVSPKNTKEILEEVENIINLTLKKEV